MKFQVELVKERFLEGELSQLMLDISEQIEARELMCGAYEGPVRDSNDRIVGWYTLRE